MDLSENSSASGFEASPLKPNETFSTNNSEVSSMKNLPKYLKDITEDFHPSNEMDPDEYFNKLKEVANFMLQNGASIPGVETAKDLEEFHEKLLEEVKINAHSKENMELFFYRQLIKFSMDLQRILKVTQRIIGSDISRLLELFTFEFLNWGMRDKDTTADILGDYLYQIQDEVDRVNFKASQFPDYQFAFNDAINWISRLFNSLERAFDWRISNHDICFSIPSGSLKVQHNIF